MPALAALDLRSSRALDQSDARPKRS